MRRRSKKSRPSPTPPREPERLDETRTDILKLFGKSGRRKES